MTISVEAIELLILVATFIVAIAPVVLITLWIKEKIRGHLW